MIAAGGVAIGTEDLRLRSVLVDGGPLALLDPETREQLIRRGTVQTVGFGDTVFLAGDAADALYVVVSGKARIVGVNGAGEEVTLHVARQGEAIGLLDLVAGPLRAASARAADELVLLRVDREDFDRFIAGNPAVMEPLCRLLDNAGIQYFLKQFTAFETLAPAVLRALVDDFEEVSAAAGANVVREGDAGDRLFIVRSGALDVFKGDGAARRQVGQIGGGEIFGELALLNGAPRAATVVARSDCRLFTLGRPAFERAMNASPEFRSRIEQRAASHRAAPAVAPAPAADPAPSEEQDPPRPRLWRRFLKQYPFIAQHDETDCAAASLAMITAYYGSPVGLARLRDLANVDADGATMWSVARAAESLGFHARGLQLTWDALRELPLPAVVHWESHHFVVLYEAGARSVVLGDPGIGIRRLTAEQFLRGWRGRALELVPTAKLGATEKIKSPFRRFWPIVRPQARLLGEVVLASLLLNVLAFAIPLFTQMILDRVVVHRSADLLQILTIGMLGVAAFQAVLLAVRRFLLVHVSTHVSARLNADYLRHVFELPMKFFDLRRVGDVVSRAAENDKIRKAMVGTLPGVILDTVLAAGSTALMAAYSPRLTLAVLAAVPVFVVLVLAFTPAIRRNRKERSAAHANSWSRMIESFTGIGTVKSMGVEAPVRARLESLHVESLLADRRGARLEAVYSALAALVHAASAAALLAYGARQVLDGTMTAGQVLAFSAMAANVILPILRLVEAWDELQDVRNALDRLNDVFDARPEEGGRQGLIQLRSVQGRITFEKVTFKYSAAQDRPTLAGIDLDIRPGETVAVVGRSGSGKSTLAKLLLGLYPPTQGRVLVDGHDLRAVSRRALRRRVGLVPQDVFLFSGTIRENLSLDDPDLPFEKIATAARKAGAHDFIAGLGLGYDTKVGERGMSLSGGQRQRVALARALARDPDILVLDEATSALDAESERAIQASLKEASRGRTTIIIAHRLSTVKDADRILVLDGGAIVEEGTHEALVARRGLYASLVNQQVSE